MIRSDFFDVPIGNYKCGCKFKEHELSPCSKHLDNIIAITKNEF